MRNILIVAGGVVAVAAIAAGAYFGTRPATTGTAAVAPVSAPNTSALAAVQPGDHVLGDPKAPITLIEYASFTCPHCAHFHTQVLPEIKKKWIDTGKVKLVYRDFPLDQVAAKAAQIAECAGNDRYFGVIDIISAASRSGRLRPIRWPSSPSRCASPASARPRSRPASPTRQRATP